MTRQAGEAPLNAPLTRWLSVLLECGPSEYEAKAKAELLALLTGAAVAPGSADQPPQENAGEDKDKEKAGAKDSKSKDAKAKDKDKTEAKTSSRPSTGKAKATAAAANANNPDTTDTASLVTAASAITTIRLVTRQEIEKAARAAAVPAHPTISREKSVAPVLLDAATNNAGTGSTWSMTAATATTPKQLALGYQHLILRDQEQEFMIKQPQQPQDPAAAAATATATATASVDGTNQAPEQAVPATFEPASQSRAKPEDTELATTSMRVYVLVDYPSTVAEADALLQTSFGSGSSSRSLLDGVVLLVDLVRELRGRRKSASGSVGLNLTLNMELEDSTRRKSRTGSCRLNEGDSLSDVATPLPSAFETANPLVKQLFDQATRGSLWWKDFLFTELETNSIECKPVETLRSQLMALAQTIADDKYAFLEWNATVQVVPIPEMTPRSHARDPLFQVYNEALAQVHPRSVNVAVVLFAMQEAIARTCQQPDDPPTTDMSKEDLDISSHSATTKANDWIANMLFESLEYGDLASCRLALSIDHYDSEAAAFCAPSVRVDTLEKRMWLASDLPGVGNKGRKAMPKVATLSAVERSVHETEFAHFCAIPLAKVQLTSQLMQLETLLGSSWRNKLRKREWIECLSKQILPQRLGHVLLTGGFPSIFKHYDDQHDQLLLAVLNPTASGRFRTTSWNPRDAVRHVVSFKDWRREKKIPEEYLTPRTIAAAGACVPVTALQLDQLAEKVFVLFPADQSVIRVTQKKNLQLNWLSIYVQDGAVLGLRAASSPPVEATKPGVTPGAESHAVSEPAPSPESSIQDTAQQQQEEEETFQSDFFASFADDSSVFVTKGKEMPRKPDGYGTMDVLATFATGLVVQTCSDGTISQRFVTGIGATSHENSKQDPGEREIERIIDGEGNVVSKRANGSCLVMAPNGDVHKFQAGQQEEENEEEDEDDSQPLMQVDPHSNALIERKPGGVVLVTYPNGSRTAFHGDGTIICHHGTGQTLVHKANFASVLLDLEANETAGRHATGQKVALTKGGRRVRTSIQIGGEDDTLIEVLYDTSVIAEVNGTIRVVKKALGSKIIVKDSGQVEYSPRDHGLPQTAIAEQMLTIETPDDPMSFTSVQAVDEQEQDTDRNGVFYFDCALGDFQLCDVEQNRFRVQMGDFHGAPQISVDLAGTVGEKEAKLHGLAPIAIKAVINEPMEPFLFVLHGDGTGQEILRPRDAMQFLEAHRRFCDRPHELEQILDESERGEEAPDDSNDSCSNNSAEHPEQVFEDFNFVVPLLQSHDALGIRRLYEHLPSSSQSVLMHEMQQLLKPGITTKKWLPRFQMHPLVPTQRRDFVMIRRLARCCAMSQSQVDAMTKCKTELVAWRRAREQNKDQFKVEDPRDEETLAVEAALSKKVIAAHKAVRAKKKMARLQKEQQKQQELKSKSQQLELFGAATASTHRGPGSELPVLDEAEEEPQHESDEEDLPFQGENSDDDGSDLNTADQEDDFDSLLWTAFANEDVENLGKLSLLQTRRALVHALGFGASQQEIKAALERCNTQDTSQVTFDAFAEVAGWLQETQQQQEQQGDQDHATTQYKSTLPVGSATAVVRSYKS